MQKLPRALTHIVDGPVGTPSLSSPVRIVLDNVNTNSAQTAFKSYEESKRIPHITLDPYRKEVWQHIDLGYTSVRMSNPPVETHRMGRTIWVTVMKSGPLDSEQSFWVGSKAAIIAEEVGCTDYWMAFPSEHSADYRTSQLSLGLWKSFEGICGAAHVPHTPSNGPGSMDLEAFAEGLVDGSTPRVTQAVAEDKEVTISVVQAEEVHVDAVVHDPDVSGTEWTSVMLGEFPGRKVKLGSGGKAVEMLREAFGLGGGKFDEELLENVLDAQNAAGMTTDGIVDRDTWTAIQEYLEA